jgi:hypothetical protein
MAVVEVVDGGAIRPLIHQCRHSPTGFAWGYGGSGPADLARSILADVMGRIPEPTLYQAFKFDHVASWGDQWCITEDEVRAWLAAQTKGGRQTDDQEELGGL